jgi:colanic acid/amylovoran biosynthesis glycosyltransferase
MPHQAPESRRGRVDEVVCIAAPLAHQYSETFIDAHAERLPARVIRVHSGYFPTRTAEGVHLLTMAGRAAASVLDRPFPGAARAIRTRALRRHLRRRRVTAVLAEYGQTGVSVLPACQAADVPLIVHFHGSDAFKQQWLRDYGAAYPHLCATADAVIATSREMEEHLLAMGAPRERLFHSPCGADTTRFSGGNPAHAPPTFVAVGRFVDKKAPHLTLLAFQAALARCPDARLVMIGDGELLEACRHLSVALRIAHAVEFPGPLPPAEIAARLRTARAFVQHSVRTTTGDREGTPVAVLEAGATGLPVVATRHAGIRDAVLDGQTGLLVDEGDVESMARHLITLATDRERAAALGAAGCARVRAQFSLETTTRRLWNIIDGAIRRHREARNARTSHIPLCEALGPAIPPYAG